MDREEQHGDLQSQNPALQDDVSAAERHARDSVPKTKSKHRADSVGLRGRTAYEPVRKGAAGMSSRKPVKAAARISEAEADIGEFVSVMQRQSLPKLKRVDIDSEAFTRAYGACIEAFRQTYLRETVPAKIGRPGIGIGIEEPDLPQGPPGGMTWAKDHRDDETPADFLQRVYGDWLERGMTKRQLRQRDASLVILLNAWLKEQDATPTFLVGKLPSKREQYDRLVGAYESRHASANPAEVRRFSDAMRRRRKG